MLKWYLRIHIFIEYLKCVSKSNCIWIIRNDSKKKSEDRVLGSGFGLRVGSGRVLRFELPHLEHHILVSELR